MKILTLALAALFTVATVNATALNSSLPDSLEARGHGEHHFCNQPGEPCTKMKRAAETAAQEVRRDPKIHHFCNQPGEPCTKLRRAAEAAGDALTAANELAGGPESCYLAEGDCAKAKRGALALAEAVAQAAEEADPSNQSCYLSGNTCSVSRRAALETAEQYAKAINGGKSKRAHIHRLCNQPGEPCLKVRRAAEIIAEVIAEPDAQDLGEGQDPCYDPEGTCTKHKRALAGLSDIVDSIL